MSPRPASLRALALALAMAASTAAVRADEATDREAARAKVKEGADRYLAHDYAGALALFQAGYRAYPSPRIEFDMAQCLHRLQRFPEAAQLYQQFLDDSVSDPKADAVSLSAAKSALDSLDAKVFRLAVATTPEGAQVAVDGAPVVSGRAFLLRGAPHTLTASAVGFDSRSVPLAEPASGALRIAVSLQPAAAVPPDAGPSLDIVDAGPPARLTPPPPPETAGALTRTAPSHTASWVAWGAGAGLAVGGTVSGVLAIVTSQQIAAAHHSCPPGGSSAFNCGTWKAEAETANALFSGALVGAGVGGVLWLTAGPGPTPRSATASVATRF